MAVREKGKRKAYVYNPKKTWLIFRGWNIPLKTERELSPMSYIIDGTFRVGGVDDVVKYVKENNINEQFNDYDRVIDVAKNPMTD